MPALPDLPEESAVWAEANRALLDQLRRADPAHALGCLARACVHLLGNRHCRIQALDDGLPLSEGGLRGLVPAAWRTAAGRRRSRLLPPAVVAPW